MERKKTQSPSRIDRTDSGRGGAAPAARSTRSDLEYQDRSRRVRFRLPSRDLVVLVAAIVGVIASAAVVVLKNPQLLGLNGARP